METQRAQSFFMMMGNVVLKGPHFQNRVVFEHSSLHKFIPGLPVVRHRLLKLLSTVIHHIPGLGQNFVIIVSAVLAVVAETAWYIILKWQRPEMLLHDAVHGPGRHVLVKGQRLLEQDGAVFCQCQHQLHDDYDKCLGES